MNGVATDMAGTRGAIAQALGEIDGITAYTEHPHGPVTQGAAWPVWVRSEYLDVGGCIANTEWDLLVVLPVGAMAAPVDAADRLAGLIADALHRTHIGTVTYAEPVALTDDGGMPAVRFRITTATT